tara:strand:+ start:832 stop:1200 length:369 start_codon:yes stop_codon:yes gene_type:complete
MKQFILIPLLIFFFNANAQLLAESDKQNHFAAGTIIGGITYGIALQETEDKTVAFVSSVVAAFAAGYIKETFDANQGYGFDNRDMLATTYGGLSVGIVFDIFVRDGKKKKRIINFRRKNKRN